MVHHHSKRGGHSDAPSSLAPACDSDHRQGLARRGTGLTIHPPLHGRSAELSQSLRSSTRLRVLLEHLQNSRFDKSTEWREIPRRISCQVSYRSLSKNLFNEVQPVRGFDAGTVDCALFLHLKSLYIRILERFPSPVPPTDSADEVEEHPIMFKTDARQPIVASAAVFMCIASTSTFPHLKCAAVPSTR